MTVFDERIGRLRERMRAENIDFYLIPTADDHASEYVSDYYKITDETEHILEAEVILPGGGEPEGGRQAGIWNCKGEDHG